MRAEELLVPRVIVVAPMPFITDEVGEITELRHGLCPVTRVGKHGEHFTENVNPVEYPLNFRGLEWHEFRELSDMPWYVRLCDDSLRLSNREGYEVPAFDSVKEWGVYTSSDGDSIAGQVYCILENYKTDYSDKPKMNVLHFLPASKEEYEVYISSKTR